MKARILTMLAALAFVAVACKQEAAPPPMPAPAPAPTAPQAMPPQAQAPAPAAPAPTVVYASAEPQHGGMTQKVGDYMVELATGGEGKVDFYVTKYEGATPSFENVQLGVVAKSKTEVDKEGEPLSQHVVFYPKEGKLQGTVAGMKKSMYDFDVTVFELESQSVAEGTFENVEIDPLKTEIEGKHDGTVYVVEKAKMEFVHEGSKLKVYLLDLEDKALGTEGNTLKDLRIGVGESEESVELEPVGDHFEGEIESEIPDDEEVEIKYVHLMLGDESYNNMRMRYKYMARLADHAKTPKLTKTEAQKLVHVDEMKGTTGTMKVATPPKGLPKKETAPTGKKTKKSKGIKSKAKKAGEKGKKTGGSSGKKTKKSKGIKSKAKKAK